MISELDLKVISSKHGGSNSYFGTIGRGLIFFTPTTNNELSHILCVVGTPCGQRPKENKYLHDKDYILELHGFEVTQSYSYYSFATAFISLTLSFLLSKEAATRLFPVEEIKTLLNLSIRGILSTFSQVLKLIHFFSQFIFSCCFMVYRDSNIILIFWSYITCQTWFFWLQCDWLPFVFVFLASWF